MVIAYDSKLLHEWDHTATITCGIYNLTTCVINMVSKQKIKPRSPSHFHPYRAKPKTGLQITPDNFTDLMMIGNAMMSNK